MRLGLIGLGRVTWQLEADPLRSKPCTHLGAWRCLPMVDLVAVCDLDASRLSEFCNAHPGVRGYSDYRAMLAAERLDLLSIAAYADTRYEMVLSACTAGVKAIWCEKAMATSLDEARQIVDAVNAAGVRFAVSFPRRWCPTYQWVARGLQNREFGHVESVNVHFSSNFAHTGTHAFDVLRMWFGEVQSVRGWLQGESQWIRDSGYRHGAPLTESSSAADLGGFALLDFENGVRATIHAHAKRYLRFEFEILTDECMLRIGNAQLEVWHIQDSSRYSGFRELAPSDPPKLKQLNLFAAVAQNLVNTDPIACSAVDGLNALAIALAIHESHGKDHQAINPQEVNPALRILSR